MNFFSNRAFAAFTVALAASMWALFTDIGRPYLPSVPILVYTLYLYANRSSVGQLGGDALKDSPYFLGFLLTMFALFKIFNDVATSSSLFGQNPALMTQEVGGAVLTTIVGLFCRQALLALVQDEAPEEDDRLAALANAVTSHAVAFEVARQQFFREMAEERERQSAEWNAAQERMLARLESAEQARGLSTAAQAAPISVAPMREASPETSIRDELLRDLAAREAVAREAAAREAAAREAAAREAAAREVAAREAAAREAAAREAAAREAAARESAAREATLREAAIREADLREATLRAAAAREAAAREAAATGAVVEPTVPSVPTVRTPTPTEPPRTTPYAGPPSGPATPPSSARISPVGSVPALGASGLAPGPSGATPPYPPYLGQGRASDAPRNEG